MYQLCQPLFESFRQIQALTSFRVLLTFFSTARTLFGLLQASPGLSVTDTVVIGRTPLLATEGSSAKTLPKNKIESGFDMFSFVL